MVWFCVCQSWCDAYTLYTGGYHSNSTDQHFKEEPGVFEDNGAETRVADHPLQRQLFVKHLPLGGVM